MTSLWIQIPCLNEESQLGNVLSQLPISIPGVSEIHILVINDGSTDRTVEVAKSFGVKHIVNFRSNRGLSAAFQAGLIYCIKNGADIIVNTDADNQYPSEEIVRLIEPILIEDADVVIGDRKPGDVLEFHPLKRTFQKIGSALTSSLCGVKIHDATSGFRAYTSHAASSINITNPYTYTLESLIQLSYYRFKIEHVIVKKNPSTRPSRLFKSPFQYVRKNGLVLLRSYIQFAPMKFFLSGGLLAFLLGVISISPFLLDFLLGDGNGHVQSVVVGSLFFTCTIQLIGMGFLGDAIKASRLPPKRLSKT